MRDAQKCVWMTAGVLSYRLCPYEQSCASCPLHAELSGRQAPRVSAQERGDAEESLVGLPPWMETIFAVPPRVRGDRCYHTSHVWGREIAPGRVRLGLDDIGNRLLGEDLSWRLPLPGTSLSQGDPIARVRSDDAALSIPSPLPGRVTARNDALLDYPALAQWSPYDSGWLVELNTEASMSSATGFLGDPEVVRGWFESTVGQLEACCHGLQPHEDARLGPTAATGGSPVASLREALGPEGYRRAVHDLLGAELEMPRG